MNGCFFAKCKISFYQMQKAIRDYLLTPLGDLVSRKRLILSNYIVSSCALLAIALAPNIYWVWGASLLAGASSVMPQFFIPLVSYNSAPDHKVRNVGIIQSCLLIGILGSRVLSKSMAQDSSPLSEDASSCLHGCWHFGEMTVTCG